jgi:hypothetical protein
MLGIPALAGDTPGKGAPELMTTRNKNEIDEKYKENGLVIRPAKLRVSCTLHKECLLAVMTHKCFVYFSGTFHSGNNNAASCCCCLHLWISISKKSRSNQARVEKSKYLLLVCSTPS